MFFLMIAAFVDDEQRDSWPLFRVKFIADKIHDIWRLLYLGIAGCLKKSSTKELSLTENTFIGLDFVEDSSTVWSWLT